MIYWISYPILLCLCITLTSAAECSKYVKVASGDYCYKLWTDNGLTEAQFHDFNPGINCDALQLGQNICVKIAEECSKTYKIASGDYCYKIWTDNNLTEPQFHDFNPDINCDALQIGQQICLQRSTSSLPKCTKAYKIVSGDSCYKIWTDNNLTENEFHAINPSINCDALQIGLEVCLDGQSPPLQGCIKDYEVIPGDNCLTIQKDFVISLPELLYLNKNLNCSNLGAGQKFCLAMENVTYECLQYEAFTSTFCSSLVEKFNITQDQFKVINYGWDCASNTVSLPFFKGVLLVFILG